MTRKRYDDEFKIAAAKLVREPGYTVKKAAVNLGVDIGSIRRWVREFGSAPNLPTSGATAEQLQHENARLREENRRLLHGTRNFKKSGHLLREGADVKFAFIRDHRESFPVEALCDVLDVTRGGYYAWSRRSPSSSDLRRIKLVEQIRQAYSEGRANYGSPRVFKALRKEGVACCENTVAKLMKAEGICSKSKRPSRIQTTDSRHDQPVAANILNREFYPDRANKVWTADITYVPTAEGWLYLAVVLDLFSRRVIGWATADHLRAELTCKALEMALTHRRPNGKLLHHSDRGSQYASGAYQDLLARHGAEPSMNRAGNCHDNAVTESFISTLKGELTHHESYAGREEARSSIFEYIEVFYNRKRLHSTLGYRSPADYEVRFAS